MKKTLILLFLVGLSCFVLGQGFIDKKIDFKVENIPIDQAINKLASQTGIDIAYSKNFFGEATVTVDEQHESVRNILKKILADTPVEYKTLGENRVLLFIGKVEYKTVSGYVENAETGERVVGARVTSVDYGAGSLTNEYGFFSFQIPANKTNVSVRSVGFKPFEQEVSVTTNSASLNLKIIPAEDLPAIVVDGREKMQELAYSAVNIDRDNITEISPRMAKEIPTLSGQTDFVRVVQMLPGVQGQSDGFGGVSIRGGESGQNLMLMDGSPVYIPYHLLGLYSTYNPETVKTVKVVKGNFPARYGGAVSSILDVRIREGDLYHWKASADVNFITAGVCIEGPLKKGKGSFMIAGRYSPGAYFFKPAITRMYSLSQSDNLESTFYDVNMKVNYKFSEKDHIYLSFFSGKDVVFQSSLFQIDIFNKSFLNFDLDWQNTLGSLRWNHLFSQSLFLNTTFTYSRFSNRFSSQNEFQYIDPSLSYNDLFVIDNRSENLDLGVKTDFDYTLTEKHKLRFGLNYNYRNFAPNFYALHQTTFDTEDPDFGEDIFDYDRYYETQGVPTYFIHEGAAYLEDHIKLTRWYFNLGARLSGFYHKNSEYLNIEPRILTNYAITEKMNASLALNRRVQYLHLIANPSIQLPNDLWLPASHSIKPQELYEAETALEYRFTPQFKLILTGYYRHFNDLYSYPSSLEFLLDTNDYDYTNYDYLVKGQSDSKGLELLTDYSDSRKGLLFTYTLSKTTHKFDSINLGIPYRAYLDRRHQVNVAFHYDLTKSVKVGLNWVYNSPRPKINVLQFSSNGVFPNIDEDPPGKKNTTQGSSYNRFDINIQFNHTGKKVKHQLQFGIYNFLNARNTAFYQFQYIDSSTDEVISTPLASLPILPSFSYRISF